MNVRLPVLILFLVVRCFGQNVVNDFRAGEALPPVKIDRRHVEDVVATKHRISLNIPDDPAAIRIRTKLVEHVQRLVRGWPWLPFHCTLGISGSETYFDHPDRLFHALSMALPYLPEQLQKEGRELLARQLVETPPYAVAGFDRDKGQARERYDVPAGLRLRGRGSARSLFGIAAFGEFLAFESAFSFWEEPVDRFTPNQSAIIERVRVYFAETTDSQLEKIDPEQLNGDLAGLIAFARLLTPSRDADLYARVLRRITQLAEIRVNIERADTQLLSPASTASKRLHHVKLSRFGNLVPEIVEILDVDERRLGVKRLEAFRGARPGWWMAFGERTIGGENYINAPHLSHATFAGAALMEGLERSTLAEWIDVPWCEGDFFFIEKCVLALRAR